jgi:hypothetical protein
VTTALQVYDRCATGQCPHCAAGSPPAPDGWTLDQLSGIWELDDDVRLALPPQFHQPHFDGLGKPNMWLCTACWGDGWVMSWPCEVAKAHGSDVAKAMGVGWSR